VVPRWRNGAGLGSRGSTGAAVQPLVGGIADASSLHVGLSVLVVFSIAAALLGTRLPSKGDDAP